MLYHLYELSHAAISPARAAADSTRLILRNPFNPLSYTNLGRNAAAAAELLERTTRRYKKPGFNIKTTTVKGKRFAVSEEIVWRKPFCDLIHFKKDLPEGAPSEPRVLIVAPLSGHFATLLRGTVEAMLPYTDVYITDWQDARLIPLRDATFSLDDYIDYVIGMIEIFQGDVHVLGVCQPGVPVLSAVALMEARNHPFPPRSVILKGSPIDTRVSPTAVNKLAEEKGTNWFRRTVITSVPWPNRGHGRLVYPGFLQLTGFMAMNLDRHLNAHKDLFVNLVRGDGNSVEKHKEFYDEYLAVMDLAAEFYMQTIDQVFVKHQLPKGEMYSSRRTHRLDGDPSCRPDDGRRREGRHYRRGPNRGGHPPLHKPSALQKAALHAAWRRPLRHFQRLPLPAGDSAASHRFHGGTRYKGRRASLALASLGRRT